MVVAEGVLPPVANKLVATGGLTSAAAPAAAAAAAAGFGGCNAGWGSGGGGCFRGAEGAVPAVAKLVAAGGASAAAGSGVAMLAERAGVGGWGLLQLAWWLRGLCLLWANLVATGGAAVSGSSLHRRVPAPPAEGTGKSASRTSFAAVEAGIFRPHAGGHMSHVGDQQ
jgi:hypothetical protein